MPAVIHTLPASFKPHPSAYVRHVRVTDFPDITALGERLYPQEKPWRPVTLMSQLEHFARGQLVAADRKTDRLLACCATLIVTWGDYGHFHTWDEITANGTFKTHDGSGTTLYGADIMVHPDTQGQGLGKLLYAARRELCRDLNLKRIRAMARLRDYHRHADVLTPREYVDLVVAGDLRDRTLSFQLNRGFKVLDVAPGYLVNDPESLGHAAVIEWLNPHYDESLG